MAYIAAVFRHSSCGSGDSHKNVQGSRDSNWISPRRRYKYCHLIQHTLWIQRREKVLEANGRVSLNGNILTWFPKAVLKLRARDMQHVFYNSQFSQRHFTAQTQVLSEEVYIVDKIFRYRYFFEYLQLPRKIQHQWPTLACRLTCGYRHAQSTTCHDLQTTRSPLRNLLSTLHILQLTLTLIPVL